MDALVVVAAVVAVAEMEVVGEEDLVVVVVSVAEGLVVEVALHRDHLDRPRVNMGRDENNEGLLLFIC